MDGASEERGSASGGKEKHEVVGMGGMRPAPKEKPDEEGAFGGEEVVGEGDVGLEEQFQVSSFTTKDTKESGIFHHGDAEARRKQKQDQKL